jgi:c-di-GMP-binding flagellar brake protein YcgR
MRDEGSIIVVGDKVELIGEKNRAYRTMIEEVTEKSLYLAGVPSQGGIPMLLHVNDIVPMVFYRESGRYVARMKVAGFEKVREVRYVLLLLTEEPQRDQRRGAFRLPARLKTLVCEYIDEIEKKLPIYTDIPGTVTVDTIGSKDISVTGIALTTKRLYVPGEKYLLRLNLSESVESATPFYICAAVTRSLPGQVKDSFFVGMRYFGQTRTMNEALSKYVFTRQQKIIKQQRLVEGS